jgi:hypothetical protein
MVVSPYLLLVFPHTRTHARTHAHASYLRTTMHCIRASGEKFFIFYF